MRPFGFFTVLPGLTSSDLLYRAMHSGGAMRPDDEAPGVGYYAPIARTPDELHDVRRLDTYQPVPTDFQPKRLGEALRDYFMHSEAKTSQPRGVGTLGRRTFYSVGTINIGKETNAVKLESAEETDGVLHGADCALDGAQHFGALGGLAHVLRGYAMADLLAATCLPRSTLYDLRNGTIAGPEADTLARLLDGLPLLAPGGTLYQWRAIDRAWLMEYCEWAPREVSLLLAGKRTVTPKERDVLAGAVQAWRKRQTTGRIVSSVSVTSGTGGTD